jgi:hypothetical protein
MQRSSILGLSGIDRAFAVSLFTDGAVAFAIEEDKLRRFRGLGMRHLNALRSQAIDQALSKLTDGIRGIERVAYVPPLEADKAQIEEQCAFVADFLKRHYGFSPPVAAVDHIAAHLAFERAVHGSPDHVLYASRSRAVYAGCGSPTYDFDSDFPVVRFVEGCAEFVGLDQGRIHHLENMARFGKPRFFERLRELLNEGFDPELTNKALEEATGSRGCTPAILSRTFTTTWPHRFTAFCVRSYAIYCVRFRKNVEPALWRFPAECFRVGV